MQQQARVYLATACCRGRLNSPCMRKLLYVGAALAGFESFALAAIEAAKAERKSRLIDAMESQAEVIESELDEQLERLMDPPEKVAILTEFNGMVPVDPNTLKMTRLSLEIIKDLFWDMGIPVREHLGMYSTQMEDAQQMVVDCLEALPETSDEEE